MKRWIPLRHIQTNPPIPHSIIEWLICDIEHSDELLRIRKVLRREFKISLKLAYFGNGRLLGTALKFAYVLGFRTGEILQLRVEHVLDANQTVRGAMIFDNEEITVPASFTQTVAYYSYLKRNIYRKKLQPDSPFFPDGRTKKAYDESTIARHINYFSEVTGYDITIEKTRQSGICRFYDGLGATGSGQSVQEKALEQTAKFARVKSLASMLRSRYLPPAIFCSGDHLRNPYRHLN